MSATERAAAVLPRYVRRLHEPEAAHPLRTEWLLTNGLGGFAMGTALGVPTRRYHALLVAPMNPPVDRVIALAHAHERLVIDPGGLNPREHILSLFHFASAPDRPCGVSCPVTFEKDTECRWTWELADPDGPVRVTRRLHLHDRRNAASLIYEIDAPGRPWRFELRPLLTLRDFHSLLRRARVEHRFTARDVPGGLLVATREAGVYLSPENAAYESRPQVWRSIEYIAEAARGLDDTEDAFSPGVFIGEGSGAGVVTLHASADAIPVGSPDEDDRRRRERLAGLAEAALERTPAAADDERARAAITALVTASDDFVVQRGAASEKPGATVIAGYPWFSDWGRDTTIALPGLMLATGRTDEALRALMTFARAARRGLIPNRFDDYSGPAHYNTVDASLWFVHACCEYLRATGDRPGFNAELLPACIDIVHAYQHGTDYGIGADPEDKLIRAGNPETQLTWMDAQRDGVTFTPRHGKAVEINALWHNALAALAEAIRPDRAAYANELKTDAHIVARSFQEHLYDPVRRQCFDRIEPRERDEDGRRRWHAVPETRSNQIFAVSLPHSPLTEEQRHEVLRTVRQRLLTPHGLRTLDPEHDAYIGRYTGTLFERDRAYHNGTAWPWLIGPYAEAVLRAGHFSDDARREARAALGPLIRRLDGECPGQLAEVFDGDDTPESPQHPDGCPAQAWSVAEVLRVYLMTYRPHIGP